MKYNTLNKLSLVFLGLAMLSLIPFIVAAWFNFIQFVIVTISLFIIAFFIQIMAFGFGD